MSLSPQPYPLVQEPFEIREVSKSRSFIVLAPRSKGCDFDSVGGLYDNSLHPYPFRGFQIQMGRENLEFSPGPPKTSSALSHPKILRLLYINPARLLEKGVGELNKNFGVIPDEKFVESYKFSLKGFIVKREKMYQTF